MKKIPAKVTNLERTLAFMEGITAFDDGYQRGQNPYIGMNDELMRAWWSGWDQAQTEEGASRSE